jgi:hypothetical protein
VHLRSFRRSRAASAAVPEDEPDERALDEDEDDAREERDQLVAVVDADGVRRLRRLRSEAAVAGPGAADDGERSDAREEES